MKYLKSYAIEPNPSITIKILCYCYKFNTYKYLAPYLQFTEINHPPPWVGFKVTFSHNFYSDQYTRVSQMPLKSKSQKIVKSLIWRRLQRRPNLVGFCAAALLLICNGSQLSIQNLNAATFSRKTSQWSYRLSIPNTNLILALLLLFPMYSNLKFRILNCQFTWIYKYCPWLLLDQRGYFTNSKLFFETEMYFCLLLLHKFRLPIFIESQLFFFIFLKTSSAEESEQMDNLTQGFLLCVKPFWMKWNDTVSFEHIYTKIRSKNVEANKKMLPFTFKTVGHHVENILKSPFYQINHCIHIFFHTRMIFNLDWGRK